MEGEGDGVKEEGRNIGCFSGKAPCLVSIEGSGGVEVESGEHCQRVWVGRALQVVEVGRAFVFKWWG